jgi:hypothetical protein
LDQAAILYGVLRHTILPCVTIRDQLEFEKVLKMKTQYQVSTINQNLGGDKLGYNSNWPIKSNVTMFVATVHNGQQLKGEEEASLLSLLKNNFRNPYKLWS